MENILTRIEKITNNEMITITALEKNIGASKGVLSRAIKNNTDIQSKWLQALVENYPHYDANWLLAGRGEMLINKKITNNDTLQEKNEKIIQLQNELIEAQRIIIKLKSK